VPPVSRGKNRTSIHRDTQLSAAARPEAETT